VSRLNPTQASAEGALVEKDAALQTAASAIRQADAAAALRNAELASLREQAKTAAGTFRRQLEAQLEGAPSAARCAARVRRGAVARRGALPLTRRVPPSRAQTRRRS
jgi:hypothetical protein